MLRRGNAEQTTYPWWQVLVEGLAGVGLGLALIFSPQRTLGTLISLLGIYWLAVSILALVTAFLHRGAGQRVTLIVRGLIGVAGGLLLINLPRLATSFSSDLLTNLAGIMGILVGAVGLIQAAKGGGWGAAILGGISMLLGWTLIGSQAALGLDLLWIIGLITVIGGGMSVLLSLRLRNHPEEGSLAVAGIRNPTMGVWRLFALLLLLFPAVAAIFIAWIIPIHYRGVRLHWWMVTWVCRLINRVLGVDVRCRDREAIEQHAGLLFSNHVSYLDITTIVSIAPLRFLSTAEVFKIPFLGWVADAVSTVFVDRQSQESRKSVRASITQAVEKSPTPPFVVFPEGKMGTPTQLQPFHYGSFAIAIEADVAILPVALRYEPAAIATWAGVATEPFIASFWRLVTHRGRVEADVMPLPLVHPMTGDEAAVLAQAMQRSVEDALGLSHASVTLQEEKPV